MARFNSRSISKRWRATSSSAGSKNVVSPVPRRLDWCSAVFDRRRTSSGV
jgi:hypothetical protein